MIMKNILLVLFAVLIFQACDDVESNSAALQANVESGFFKAVGTNAVMDIDRAFTITGQANNQEMILHTEWRGQKDYVVGLGMNSYASFTDADGNEFTTDSEGSEGIITITERSDIKRLVSGTFDFRSIIPGQDTIVVHSGLFFEVPFTMMEELP